MEPTLSQYKATAKFHRRMEFIFTGLGNTTDADSARKAAEGLEAKAQEIEADLITTFYAHEIAQIALDECECDLCQQARQILKVQS